MKIGYFLSETVTNLKRNLLMTVAAISTVAISLLLLGGALIFQLVVTNLTYNWEAKVEISAFLQDNATGGEVGALESDLSSMAEVQNYTYVSQAQAFEDFKRIYRNKPELYEALGEDDLPASLRIKLHDADDAAQVAAAIEGQPGVDEVNFGGEFIRRLLNINTFLRAITVALSIVLMIAAAALIANTIRLAIFARREEISIMNLVGATNWFIRIPFMFEGVFAALVGAIVSGVVVVAANHFFFSRAGGTFEFLEPVFAFSSWEITKILLILIGGGALVGLFGSFLALRRFLDV